MLWDPRGEFKIVVTLTSRSNSLMMHPVLHPTFLLASTISLAKWSPKYKMLEFCHPVIRTNVQSFEISKDRQKKKEGNILYQTPLIRHDNTRGLVAGY